MKKIIALFLSIVSISCFACVSCKSQNESNKVSVVCTIFPQYDWVKNIVGDKSGEIEITLLQKNGSDLHNFQPSADDIVKISKSDLFIYVGGESDEWVDKTLAAIGNDKLKTLNLMEALGDMVKSEEDTNAAVGSENDHEHDHDHDHEHEEGAGDEHIWLSLKNAVVCYKKITDELSVVSPENKSLFSKNSAEYITKLNSLDKEIADLVAAMPQKNLVFCDRFPFGYFAADYGLKCYAAFSGCSAETEASFETIALLAAKVDEFNLSSICILEGGNVKIAETVRNATKSKNQKIVEFESMQSVTLKDIEEGVTYLSLMRRNYEALKKIAENGGESDG